MQFINLVKYLYIRHKKKPCKRLEIDYNKKALIYTNKKTLTKEGLIN